METKKEFDFELKSEPMNEMLSKPPSWIVRSGNTLFLCIILLILTLSWLIEYSDEIKGEVYVTTTQPPIELTNQTYAQLVSINVSNESIVKKDQLLVEFDNKANKTDVEFISDYLKSIKVELNKKLPFNDRMLQLGSFQEFWITLQTKINEWNTNLNFNVFDEQINHMQQEIIYRQKLEVISNTKIKLSESEYVLIAEELKANENLFEQNIISKQSLNEFKKNESQTLQSVQSQKEQYITNLIQLNNLKSQLLTLIHEKKSKQNELKTSIEQSISSLKSQLFDWNTSAIWRAPCEGKVLFNQLLQKNKFYKANEASIIVVPLGSEYMAYAKINSTGAGSVEKGQDVFIELEDFSKNEFGMLEGDVLTITPIEKEGKYEVQILLKNQLKTTYKKQIPLKAQLKGQMKIITKKKRLLERFFENLIVRLE